MKQKFKDIEEAIHTLIECSKEHARATEMGDHKAANKNYFMINAAVSYLIENRRQEKLTELLNYNDISVKIWVASYLIKLGEQSANIVLEEIASKSIPHHSFAAKMVLQGWQKGKLNSDN